MKISKVFKKKKKKGKRKNQTEEKEKPQKTKELNANASYWPVYLFACEIIHSFDWAIVCGNVTKRRPYCPFKRRKKSSNLPRRVH